MKILYSMSLIGNKAKVCRSPTRLTTLAMYFPNQSDPVVGSEVRLERVVFKF